MSQIEEAKIQLTDERKRLSEIQILLKLGIESKVSARPETTIALRDAELAFMWLGKAKGALGATNPYPESANPGSKIIEPAQDVVTELSEECKSIISGPKKAKDLEVIFLKQGRKLLEGICKAIANDLQIMTDHRMYQICIENAWSSAERSKMRLGQALGLVRDENPGKYQSSAEAAASTAGTAEGAAGGADAGSGPGPEKPKKPAKEKGAKKAKAPKVVKEKAPAKEKVKKPAKGKKGESAAPASGTAPANDSANAGNSSN